MTDVLPAAVKLESQMNEENNDSEEDEEASLSLEKRSELDEDNNTTTGQPFTFSHLPVGMMGGHAGMMGGFNPMHMMGFGGGGGVPPWGA
ncbi:MAG: hypothetical protein WDW38_003741 [Sanguina aurantia]